MSSSDDLNAIAGPSGPGNGSGDRQVHFQLVDALIHILVEKGVLTKNDALNVVQTVAHVKLGEAAESRGDGAQTKADLDLLERMYASFEALSDRGTALGGGGNVHQLRRPIHDDRPKFPSDD